MNTTKATTKTKTAPRSQPRGSGITLNWLELQEAGFNVDVQHEHVWIGGSQMLDTEAIDHANAFAAALDLDVADTERLIETALNMAMWAKLRRMTSL